jgi:hypothetical protein
MSNDLIEPRAIPPTLENSVYYPGNDPFLQVQNQVESEIVDLSLCMEPVDVEIAKRAVKGESNRAIAKAMKKAQKTVQKIRQKPAVIQLESYLNALKMLREGPGDELRKNMLWRIAVDNEKEDPKEATKALAEINKMTGPKGGAHGVSQINIVIQAEGLTRGPLDE